MRTRSGRNGAGRTNSDLGDLLVQFPKNFSGVRQVTFKRSPGKISEALKEQVERYAVGLDRQLTATSLVTICRNGVRPFAEFLLERSRRTGALGLKDIDSDLLRDFASKMIEERGSSRARRAFGAIRSVLATMAMREIVPHCPEYLENPVKRERSTGPTYRPYSRSEMCAISRCLKKEVDKIFLSDLPPTGRRAAACITAIALRTGRNLAPLLEMKEDCLSAGVIQNSAILTLVKRRSGKTEEVQIAAQYEYRPGRLQDTGAIIRRYLKVTETLRSSSHHAGFWIYATSRGNRPYATAQLEPRRIQAICDEIAKTYTSETGVPVPRIGTMRLRKTFAEQMFKRSNGNSFLAAFATGNTPSIFVDNYLRAPAESTEKWRFMGELMVEELLTNLPQVEKTPSGHCGNPERGEFSPMNGEPCTSFQNCVRCRSYIVTSDDLYKILSYRDALARCRNQAMQRRSINRFTSMIRAIDRDVLKKGVDTNIFNRMTIEEERKRVSQTPHPFWQKVVRTND